MVKPLIIVASNQAGIKVTDPYTGKSLLHFSAT